LPADIQRHVILAGFEETAIYRCQPPLWVGWASGLADDGKALQRQRGFCRKRIDV
jgi:hypothetical protein